MILFYSVTFKIITTFHILQYQERKLYQREANKNIHGIGKHVDNDEVQRTERTNKQRTNDPRIEFPPAVDGNIYSRSFVD